MGAARQRGRSSRATVTVLASLLFGAVAAAQPAASPFGEADVAHSVRGTVTGPDEAPVAGAAISLTSPSGSLETRADAAGRWSFVGVSPGRWGLRIVAAGLVTAEGWVDVAVDHAPAAVDVQMRSIEEGTPLSWEGSRTTIVRWLELGNSLLEQGRPADARREYEKALAVLPVGERPPVLQAVARTHFLEGDVEEAVASLRAALGLAPGDEELRQLFRALMAELGRADEGEEILAAARAGAMEPREAADQGASAQWPLEVREWIEAPAAPLSGQLVGRAKVRLDRRSALSDLEVFWARSGLAREAFPDAEPHDPAAESYQLYVPSTAPEAGYGLLVWVSPTDFGGFTRAALAELLEREGIIWIGPDRAGNQRPDWQRWGLALDAAQAVERHYRLDPRRVYVAGYSGGGRTASALGTLYPEAFRGAFSWFGVSHFHPLAVPDKPGAHWPPHFPPPPDERLDLVRLEGRFVLLTGERDFNRSQTRVTWRHLEADGFAQVTYLEIPDADHYFGVPAEWMARGLAALDAPLR